MFVQRFTAVLSLLAVSAAQAQQPSSLPEQNPTRDQLIRDIKQFQKELGFPETRNFLKRSAAVKAHYRCYYTGKLTLPSSYEGLRLAEWTEAGCSLDEEKYDVFFYPIEAVADGDAPVTPSLMEASPERVSVVVAHEDLHEQLHRLPEPIAEAAATLIGFLAAARFARARFGETAGISRNLSAEAGLFLAKARIVNAYHRKLTSLYAALRSGAISREEALAEKQRSFAELERECRALTPEPRSFNKCPAAMNNAGLAFDMTYTGHYPLIFDLYLSHGESLENTLESLTRALAKGSWSEDELAGYFRRIIEQRRKSASPAADVATTPPPV